MEYQKTMFSNSDTIIPIDLTIKKHGRHEHQYMEITKKLKLVTEVKDQ